MMLEKKQGFTLIELMAGITVLTVLVLFLTRVFTDSTNMWQMGTKRVESNLSGRAAIDFMSRELAGAIFDGNLTLHLVSGATNVLGDDSDEIFFVTTDQRARNLGSRYYRQVKAIRYRVSHMDHPDYRENSYLTNRYRIVRSGLERFDDSNVMTGLYSNATWWNDFKTQLNGSNEKIIDNVRAMDFWVYDQNGEAIADYDSSSNGPPAWVDIVVEVLPESDSQRMARLDDEEERQEYFDRVSRRYFNRVYFYNYQGYALSK